jgi:methylmalonyl-CoA/ethylmalonyl-CoA epimerase
VRGFLDKSPAGGMHHVCYEVDDIIATRDRLRAAGVRVLGDGKPRLGAHDKPVLFLYPKDCRVHPRLVGYAVCGPAIVDHPLGTG